VTQRGPDPGAADDRDPGAIAAARRLGAAFVDIVHTRLDLLSTEIEEEGLRLNRLFWCSVAAIFFLGLAVLCLTGFLILLFWDDHRLAVVGVFTLAYFGIGSLFALRVRSERKRKPKPFAASLAELRKDYHRFTSGS
jgi:uncharacterized membrane protein YqjE